MKDLINKYKKWDETGNSSLIYMGYIALVVSLGVFVYFKLNSISNISFENVFSLPSAYSTLKVSLNAFRFISYVGLIYIIFDLFSNRKNFKNIAKIATLLGGSAFAVAIYIFSPVFKLVSYKALELLGNALLDSESSLTAQINRMKPDLMMSYIIFGFIFFVIAMIIFIRMRQNKTQILFKLEKFGIEEGQPVALDFSKVKVNKKLVGKLGILAIVLMIGIFTFNFWDKNFNLKEIPTADLFEVDFSGVDGEGRAEMYPLFDGYELARNNEESKDTADELVFRQGEYLDQMDAELNIENNLSNGDLVVIKINGDKNELKRLGLKLSSDELEYTVSGLVSVPKEASDINNLETEISKIQDSINFSGILPEKNGKATAHSVYFSSKEIYEKETGGLAGASNSGSSLALIFKITGENQVFFSSDFEAVEKLYVYKIEDIMLDGDGNLSERTLDRYNGLSYSRAYNVEDLDRSIEEIMKTEFGMIKVEQ